MDTNKQVSKSRTPIEDGYGNVKKAGGDDIYIHDDVLPKVSYSYVNAKEALERARRLEEEYRPMVEGMAESSPDNPAPPVKRAELNRRVHKHASSAVIHSAFAVEAMINYYGQQRVPEKFPKEERKPTKKKVREFPEWDLDRTGEDGGDLFDEIEWLFDQRKPIGHPKMSTALPNESEADYMLGVAEGERALNIVWQLYSELKSHDNKFDLDWKRHVDDDEIQGEFRMPLSGWSEEDGDEEEKR